MESPAAILATSFCLQPATEELAHPTSVQLQPIPEPAYEELACSTTRLLRARQELQERVLALRQGGAEGPANGDSHAAPASFGGVNTAADARRVYDMLAESLASVGAKPGAPPLGLAAQHAALLRAGELLPAEAWHRRSPTVA